MHEEDKNLIKLTLKNIWDYFGCDHIIHEHPKKIRWGYTLT